MTVGRLKKFYLSIGGIRQSNAILRHFYGFTSEDSLAWARSREAYSIVQARRLVKELTGRRRGH